MPMLPFESMAAGTSGQDDRSRRRQWRGLARAGKNA